MTLHPFRILLSAALLAVTGLQAQRIAFVDTKYILEQMPDYNSAQQELDRSSTQWQKEIDDRWAQIKRLREAYNAEAILLTEEMKRSRMEDITKKEQEARELQNKRFGVNGDLFKKRQELIQPIQDRIFQAVKDVAGTSYVAIFDIGGVGNNVLYASEKYDKSDSVLRKLGIKPGKDGSGNAGNVRGEEDEDDSPDDDGVRPGGNTGKEQPREQAPSSTPQRGGTDQAKPRQ